MHVSLATIATLVAGSFAQKAPALTTVVSANPRLSDFAGILTKYPLISEHIGMAGAVTFFIPLNGARGLKELLQIVNGPDANRAPGFVEWTLSYHVIHGIVPAAIIPKGSSFAESYVDDRFATSFSLVSGGQRLHILNDGSKISLDSGLEPSINVTQSVCSYLIYCCCSQLTNISGYKVR
jgi:hypothetical protein